MSTFTINAALVAVLAGCLGGMRPSTTQRAAAKDISEITLVRYGSAGEPADVLTFHSDGSTSASGHSR
jgi:hypothetical protein